MCVCVCVCVCACVRACVRACVCYSYNKYCAELPECLQKNTMSVTRLGHVTIKDDTFRKPGGMFHGAVYKMVVNRHHEHLQ